MKFNLTEAFTILANTPRVLDTLLHGVSGEWVTQAEGEDTWSAFDVVGHLIHGEETDWIPRAQIILESADKHFIPFDRFAQFEKSKGRTIESLLREFAEKRSANLATLKSLTLTEVRLEKTGIHPEFGEVTLRQLLSTWVAHDLSHIAQICRVMGRHLKQEVGPWTAYLGMLR